MNKTDFTKKLNSWFLKFKRYTVSYKNGFFHLSNLANSPYTIIESFDKMPFCKHEREKYLLTANTPFLNAQLYYYKLDDGLWIYVSEMNYKKNLLMNNLYDKSLPMNFDFINLHYREKTMKSKSMMVNGLLLTDKTWSVFKAGNAVSDYHFKDSNEKNITIYYTNEWLIKNVLHVKDVQQSSFKKFTESTNKYILIADTNSNSDYFYDAFFEWAIKADSDTKHVNLKKLVLTFFETFNTIIDTKDISADHFKLSDKDRRYIQHAEKTLLDCLTSTFPGISNIADNIGVSETKLKADFKTVHNKTLYQFFSHHQMQLAYKLISQKQYSVKEVANLVGYESPSKFSARFKEEFGIAPSSLGKNTDNRIAML